MMYLFLSTLLSGQFLVPFVLFLAFFIFSNKSGFLIIDEEFFVLGSFSLFVLAAYWTSGEPLDNSLETKMDSIHEVFAVLARRSTVVDLLFLGVYVAFRAAGPKAPRLVKRYFGLKALALWKSMGLGLIQLINQKLSRTEESLDDGRVYADAYLSVKAFYRYFVRENVSPSSRIPLHMFGLLTAGQIVNAIRSYFFSVHEILAFARVSFQFGQLQNY